jgi:hypothetical protein
MLKDTALPRFRGRNCELTCEVIKCKNKEYKYYVIIFVKTKNKINFSVIFS